MDQFQKEKKSLFGGLLRNLSLAKKVNSFQQKSRTPPPRQDFAPPRRRSTPQSSTDDGDLPRRPSQKPRRPSSSPQGQMERSRPYNQQSQLSNRKTLKRRSDDDPVFRKRPHNSGSITRWPSRGFAKPGGLRAQDAINLISKGAPVHHGQMREASQAFEDQPALYVVTVGDRRNGKDIASLHDSMTQLMTMKLQGRGYANYPWETLEQPSYAFCYGDRSGTITLNHWASSAIEQSPPLALRDSGFSTRPIDLKRILGRLKGLQGGLEVDDEKLMYKILYRRLLRDPDKRTSPHITIDRQITDLILALSRPDWIDFTNLKNQVVTRFIFDRAPHNSALYHKFFHQLLLSMELELRIHSPHHSDWVKERLMKQIPPSVRWNLAVARRWREHIRISDIGPLPQHVRLRYKLKRRQIKTLKRFAQAMKWPNLAETMNFLRQMDDERSLDSISSDSFAFFSGLILPGPTYPFLIMNTLIDLDPDSATDDLAMLSHMHPNCGFQYRNSSTYWSATCIVGKIIAPTCRSIAGWIGPGPPSPDLGRSQIARIRTRRPKQQLGVEDVESMAERSDPLGPPAQVYPVQDYGVVRPDVGDAVDTVRMERLCFKPATLPGIGGYPGSGYGQPIPGAFDCTIQFAIDGASWPLRLMYDVSFISAWPCSHGPHPLFFDYAFSKIKVDEIVHVRDWGGLYGKSGSYSANSSPGPLQQYRQQKGTGYGGWSSSEDERHDDEKVLVAEAFGVRDNEVLARAWCSHWGLSAIVADVRKTCVSCAIREAYAATLTVVILVDDSRHPKND